MAIPRRSPPKVEDLQAAYDDLHKRVRGINISRTFLSVEDINGPIRGSDRNQKLYWRGKDAIEKDRKLAWSVEHERWTREGFPLVTIDGQRSARVLSGEFNYQQRQNRAWLYRQLQLPGGGGVGHQAEGELRALFGKGESCCFFGCVRLDLVLDLLLVLVMPVECFGASLLLRWLGTGQSF